MHKQMLVHYLATEKIEIILHKFFLVRSHNCKEKFLHASPCVPLSCVSIWILSDNVDISRVAHQNEIVDVCTGLMNEQKFFHNNHIINSNRYAAKEFERNFFWFKWVLPKKTITKQIIVNIHRFVHAASDRSPHYHLRRIEHNVLVGPANAFSDALWMNLYRRSYDMSKCGMWYCPNIWYAILDDSVCAKTRKKWK